MKIDSNLLNIFHFRNEVAFKCNCKFSMFKYYSRLHQTSNGKNMFKLNLTNHVKTYLLSTFIVPKFIKFYNHLTINSKKSTMLLICYFLKNSIYFLLFVSKTRPFFNYLFLNYFFCIFYDAFTYYIFMNNDWCIHLQFHVKIDIKLCHFSCVLNFKRTQMFKKTIQILATYIDCGAQGVEQQMRVSL